MTVSVHTCLSSFCVVACRRASSSQWACQCSKAPWSRKKRFNKLQVIRKIYNWVLLCRKGFSAYATRIDQCQSMQADMDRCIRYLSIFCLLTLYFIDTHFDASITTTFENIVGKGEIARYEQFLLFQQCFLLSQITVSPFVNNFWHHIFICCLNGRADNWHIR